MICDLPIAVEINGTKHPIRNKCDYRVVLDVICALNDNELTDEEKVKCALFIFYENIAQIDDYELAIKQMFEIISNGEKDVAHDHKPRLMDWEHDFKQIVSPINRVLGYDVRTPDKYTHWYSFLSGYMEIGGECTYATIVSIRSKMAKGNKLDKWEEEYLMENRKMVELPQKLTAKDQEYLDSDW